MQRSITVNTQTSQTGSGIVQSGSPCTCEVSKVLPGLSEECEQQERYGVRYTNDSKLSMSVMKASQTVQIERAQQMTCKKTWRADLGATRKRAK